VVDGRYEVLSVLGEGGMGIVYKVRHTAIDRLFALKALRPDLARDANLSTRFVNEARATAALKHEGIVQITDFGKLEDGAPYFVMELLAGRTLAAALREGPLAPRVAVHIARRLAEALGAAHEAQVVHRDLKPENVFLIGYAGSDRIPDDVKVLDFGTAKILGSAKITKTGIVFGTPHYMSPEQAAGQPADHRVDVYALGVILYEMLTGRVPFEAESYMGVLTQHIFVNPKPPSAIAPSLKEIGPFGGGRPPRAREEARGAVHDHGRSRGRAALARGLRQRGDAERAARGTASIGAPCALPSRASRQAAFGERHRGAAPSVPAGRAVALDGGGHRADLDRDRERVRVAAPVHDRDGSFGLGRRRDRERDPDGGRERESDRERARDAGGDRDEPGRGDPQRQRLRGARRGAGRAVHGPRRDASRAAQARGDRAAATSRGAASDRPFAPDGPRRFRGPLARALNLKFGGRIETSSWQKRRSFWSTPTRGASVSSR
jgi:tRNA A-37 threonylcarbamoyl transferase component Bud32